MLAFPRSLRFRITMAFVLWTGLILLLMAVAVPSIRGEFVLRSIDERLEASVRKLTADISRRPSLPDDLTEWSRDPRYQGWGEELYMQLRAPDGRVLASSSNIQGFTLPFDRAVAERGAGLPVSSMAPAAHMPRRGADEFGPEGASRARVMTAPIRSPDGRVAAYLQVGRSMRSADHVATVFQVILWAAVGAGVVGAVLAGWIVSGRICARIDRVSRSVRQISPTNLDERVELGGMHDELGRMAADINVMLERLAQGFRSQERFISDVSHELKTPVAVLLTEAQAMKMGTPGPEEQRLFMLSVEDEMRRLGTLVESFLMLARFGHGRRLLGDLVFAVNDVALESVQHAKMLASQHGVTTSLTLFEGDSQRDEALLSGDPELVGIVIDNLIRNAIQYSKRGDTVKVTVACRDEHAVISVQDQGRGVPEQYLDTIFDRFAQAPGPPSSGRRGTGLGLAIAKGVVDLHGGAIRVQNRAEGGCVFTVTLPLTRKQTDNAGGNSSRLMTRSMTAIARASA